MTESQPMERLELLRRLLALEESPENICERLARFGWDSEELITLTAEKMCNILRKYTSAEIDEKTLRCWADSIECREDIAFEEDHEALISNIIFELSNPALGFDIDKEGAMMWVEELSQPKN